MTIESAVSTASSLQQLQVQAQVNTAVTKKVLKAGEEQAQAAAQLVADAANFGKAVGSGKAIDAHA